jgi:O-antigen ligase
MFRLSVRTGIRTTFGRLAAAAGTTLLLSIVLFHEAMARSFPRSIGNALGQATDKMQDAKTQWIFFLCFGAALTVLLGARSQKVCGFWRANNANLWLAGALLVSALVYTFNDASSVQALMLLGCAALGQWVASRHGGETEIRHKTTGLVVFVLLPLLAMASLCQASVSPLFEYRGQARSTGPWNSPNIFGLLMGTGVVLGFGYGLGQAACGKYRKWLAMSVGCLSAILMSRGLLLSYSRGAWLGTVCGGAYLLWHWMRRPVPGKGMAERDARVLFDWRLRERLLPIGIILVSSLVLAGWHFRGTNWHPARRVFSAANVVDFSWRNRIAAWEGNLQIIAEKPVFGFGWNQPALLYEHYYLPPKLSEGAASEMNDYLMLGATLGIPVLGCFGRYVWLSLTKKSQKRKQRAEIPEGEWLRTVCHAGAIVLLIGFWFDGGLFKLATASVFWILVELGRAGSRDIYGVGEYG